MKRQMPVALVSGIGPGTGAAIARRFAHGGYAVAMLARNRERLGVLEREIANSHAYPCDVTDEAQLGSTIEAIRTGLGTPGVLIHNAVGGAFGNFMEIDPEVLNRNFQVNTMALLHLARPACTCNDRGGPGRNHRQRQHLGNARQSQLRWFRADQGRSKDPRRIHRAGTRTNGRTRRIRVD